MLRWDPKLPHTRQLPNVRHIRHAVSINERRRPYAEYLVTPENPKALREAWFAGVHSDVGGTFEDDPRWPGSPSSG
jgi:T6SS, Phospholipase effector Tle1-like, catalytic domain